MTEPVPTHGRAVAELDRLRVEIRMRAGADWFFWIAALALLDSYLNHIGIVTEGAFGLGMASLARYAAEQWALGPVWMPFATGVVLPVFYVLVGLLARKRRRWAFALGLGVYAADAVLVVAEAALVAGGVHFVLLGLLAMGFVAARQLGPNGHAEART